MLLKKEFMITAIQQMSFFEKFSLRLSHMIGSPISLILHTIAFGGFFILRYLGVVPNSLLLVLIAAVCLEAIYLVIFIQMIVKNNTTRLTRAQLDIEQIQQEEKDAYKLTINLLHITHQMKTLQQDVDLLKKSGTLKRTNGNGHRVHA